MTVRRIVFLILAVCFVLAPAGNAQAVRGRISSPSGVPVAGAIVTLHDSADTPILRALSDDNGEVAMRLSGPGVYRFHIMRLGFRSYADSAFRVNGNSSVIRALTLPEIAVPLQAANTAGDTQCLANPDSTSAAFDAWQEVRKALLISQLTRMTRAYSMDVVLFVSRRSADARDTPSLERKEVRMETLRPFVTLAPEQLATEGYLNRGVQHYRYYAPDETVLLSESFANTHCLRLLPDSGSEGLLRLGFSPLPNRSQPDIKGMMLLDRATSDLTRIEFSFVNLKSEEMKGTPGGELRFLRLSEGSSIIEYWALSIPYRQEYTEREVVTPPPVRTRRPPPPPRIPAVTIREGHTMTGGGVTRVMFNDQVLWKSAELPTPQWRSPISPDR